jgi:hypothetical protein
MPIVLSLFIVIASLLQAGPANKPQKTVLSSFCQAGVADEVKQANMTFTETYSLSISKTGAPSDVRAVKARFTRLEEVVDCLKEWRFKGFDEGSTCHVELGWKHGIGWAQMRISCKNFSQQTILGGNACPPQK